MIILRIGKRGITFIEVMIAMIVLALVMLSVARGFLYMNRQSLDTHDRAFAAQKAIQMMEELRGLISNTNSSTIGVLDDYDDGATMSAVLTSNKSVTDPADYLSGNPSEKFVRRINVVSMANEPLARRVHVRIFRAGTLEPLAETVSVIRTISNQYANTQVFDVYVISIENVPGWWVSLSSMKPMFDNVIQDLQTRNPGLEWRTHWITRLSYGRDPYYTPVINEATKTNLVAPAGVYFYPGNMDKPSVGDFMYYVADYFTGRINIDGTVANADSYTIADQYNHAVRYPEEEEIYAERVDAAENAGEEVPEISLRMLLERMNTLSSMDNILLVNLHGELLPLPPMRNYSDAAKDPAGHANVRAVTHPENLQYATGSEVRLRAYTYVTNPDSWAAGASLSTTTILIKNLALDPGDVTVRKMTGNNAVAYSWGSATSGTDYALTTDNGHTIISLYSSPLRHPQFGTTGGLPSTDRLYNLEYIPCLVSSQTVFNENIVDLAWPSNTRPKNTARWVISIAAGNVPDGRLEIQTRVGDDYTTGTSTNQPSNISRTYTWVNQTPPVTEQSQFMGDPRHMPYADGKNNRRFNWYFTSVNGTDWPNFTAAVNGWDGSVNVDIPRYFQLFRNGLLASNGLFTSMTGFSFYYVGLGGEMGYDASNGFSSGLPIIRTPWSPASASSVGVDEITSSQTEPYARLISNTADTWLGLHWIGELYPDDAFATWEATGNLPIGSGNFYRARYINKGFSYNVQKRTGQRGASSFFNGSDTGTTGSRFFTHEYMDGQNATVSATGLQLAQDFNFPLLSTLTAARPFKTSSTSGDRQPPEWSDADYSGSRTTLTAPEIYYEPSSNSSSQDASALIRIRQGTDYGNMIMNGLSPQNDFGAAQISKLCAINLIRGFMKLGETGTSARIPQVPLVSLSSPTVTQDFNNPLSIDVSWSSSWLRWDSRAYTSGYTAGYTEATTIVYNVKYSNDNGKTWFFLNGTAAEAGVYNAGLAVTSPTAWDTSLLPRGTYVVRVEGFRDTVQMHYTYHQRQIYIQR